MNAETSVDHTTYYLRLLKDDLPLGVDVLADIVSEPLLDGEELAREQHVVIQEIGAAQDVPEDWVFELFQEAAFPGQAIGRSILGTPDSIRSHTTAGSNVPCDALRGPRTVLARRGPRSRRGRASGEEHLRVSPHFNRTRRSWVPTKAANGPGAPGTGDSDPGGLRGAVLSRPGLPRRPSPLLHPRRRHGIAALPGAAREPRACYSISSSIGRSAIPAFSASRRPVGGGRRGVVPVIMDEFGKMADGITGPSFAAPGTAPLWLADDTRTPIARASQMGRHVSPWQTARA